MSDEAQRFRARVDSHIEKHGHSVVAVGQSVVPRFAYTVGLTRERLPELIFAGGGLFSTREVQRISNGIASSLREGHPRDSVFDLEGNEGFRLGPVDAAWHRRLMLAAHERFGDRVEALQILAPLAERTLDTPDLSSSDIRAQRVWRWLVDAWDQPVSGASSVATNLAMLRGGRVTEIARWESDYWEAFVGPGPEVEEGQMRIIALATAVGIDPSLAPMMRLPLNEGLRRDGRRGDWKAWRMRTRAGDHGNDD